MHIAIVGPIATDNILAYLYDPSTALPKGYSGAPLLGSIIGQLLKNGHIVSAFTLSNDISLNSNFAISAVGDRFTMYYCAMRPRAWRSNGKYLGRVVDLYRRERHALTETIARARPDVIHAHWAYEFASASIATGLPHVITCHDSPFGIAKIYTTSKPTISGYRWLRAFMAKKVLREARFVTTVSPYLRDQVQGITSSRIQVVPNPVDDLALTLAKPRQPSIRPAIAMVCNGWDARKNPEPGLLAFNKLLQDIPGATMHLYGNDFGPGQTAEKWCKANGIQQSMYFHGSMPHKQLLKQLTQHDLLLHTSIEESFGMVIAEAMAMGLPVVAGRDSGAVPWVVGDSGTLCDIRDCREVAVALANALSPERYPESSLSGIKDVAARFSTTAVTDELFAIYKTAITAGSSTDTGFVSKESTP